MTTPRCRTQGMAHIKDLSKHQSTFSRIKEVREQQCPGSRLAIASR